MFIFIAVRFAMDYGMVSYSEKMTYIYLTLAAAFVLIKKLELNSKDVTVYETDE